jgi:glycosyltransferase involved in cell wall biosynthesis
MLSIIVSWRDRVELGRALPGLIGAAQAVGGGVTIVNYSGSRELLQAQLGSSHDEVQVVTVAGERFFNKSRAQNVGAAHSHGDILFFCDCDIVLDPATVQRLVERLRASPGHFATLAGVSESEVNSRGGRHVVSFGYELEIRTADGRSLSIVDNEEDAQNGTRQAPGLLLVRRSDFVAVNGYNSGLHGWGWEDQDMIARLTLGRGLTRINEGYALHLSHDDHARIAHYPPVKDRWESRDRMFRTALANYDDANFRGTYAEDVAALVVRAA